MFRQLTKYTPKKVNKLYNKFFIYYIILYEFFINAFINLFKTKEKEVEFDNLYFLPSFKLSQPIFNI